MAVSLTSYPVTTSTGKVRNIFAGFSAVELEFKREDTQVVTVSQGAANKILIDIATDITGSLNVGEWIYLYSVGVSYTYDGVFQIIAVVYSAPNTEITVQGEYIQSTALGYCNYKQNWFFETKLVDFVNNDILVYPKLLQNDGSPAGIVEVNTSMLVDFLKNEIKATSQEIANSRQDCQVMWRESWREDDTESFALIDEDPIIIIYAAEDSEIENFVNNFITPRIWAGYPFFMNILHSLQNEIGKRISVKFDEIDINKNNITLDNRIIDFELSNFGILQTNFEDKTKAIKDNTRFIRLNANSIFEPDYLTGDYTDAEYLTINTP